MFLRLQVNLPPRLEDNFLVSFVTIDCMTGDAARGDSPSSTTGMHARRARSGDARGFSDLYARLAPAVYAWAALRIDPGYRGRLDPEDVVQEVWWRALDAFDRYDPERGSFRAWIFTVATNVLLVNFRRLRVREGEQGPARREPASSELAAEMTSISQRAARNENVQQLLEAARSLDPTDRSLLVHIGLEGLPVADAAELIAVTPSAAAKRWQRLRIRLRASSHWRSLLT